MKKKTGTGLLMSVLAVSLAVTPCYAATQKKKLTDVQGRLNSLEAKKDDLEGYLTELDKQLGELGANLKVIQTQSEKRQKELELLNRDLEAAQKIEEKQYASMKLRIQYMYENAEDSYLMMLLEAKNLPDFLSQAENMAQVTKYDRKMLEEYKKVTTEIKEKEESIKKEQKKLEGLKQQSLSKQDEISSIMKSTNVRIASYNQEISAAKGNISQLLNQIEGQKNTIDKLIKQEKDEEAASAQKPQDNQNNAQNQPEQETKPPADTQTPPEQETKPPADTQTPPAQETKPPADTQTPPPQNNNANGQYLGNFRLTAYCNGPCCGGDPSGMTASGTYPVQGRTVAMGGVAFGTKLRINGVVYTVEDRGTPYGHVDIYFDSHQDALNFGSRYADVYQVN